MTIYLVASCAHGQHPGAPSDGFTCAVHSQEHSANMDANIRNQKEGGRFYDVEAWTVLDCPPTQEAICSNCGETILRANLAWYHKRTSKTECTQIFAHPQALSISEIVRG